MSAKSFASEKSFQRYIIDRLVKDNGYVERADADFDRDLALDTGMLLKFLEATQPKEMAALKKLFKEDRDAVLVNFINSEMTKPGGSALSVLQNGVELDGVKLELLAPFPVSGMNPKAKPKYEANILSVAEEVWASYSERMDLVVFANGIPVAGFELKATGAGQNWEDAVRQYREDRNPKTRLFMPRAGCVVYFAMDEQEVHMTTCLAKGATRFLPFNRGSGKGIDAGKGNTAEPGKYATAYVWENILRKDTLVDIVKKYAFFDQVETKNSKGKKHKTEELIFPRFHQLDCVRKILADVRENRTARNYLVEHSAGSGKTNSIAWLAYRLASQYDAADKIVFDTVVIVTDRVVVDRQLQRAITRLRHKDGFVKVLDDECTSRDLAVALEGNTKIVATTIQKFPYILDSVASLKGRNFAVVVDEAHSSTAGRNMLAVKQALGGDFDPDDTPEEVLRKLISKQGKQPNVSMFAFTATPKAETIQLFGTLQPDGRKAAFHVYSMRQAIEEGFILDVLQNFVECKTYFEIVKLVADDPIYKASTAAAKIKRMAMLHDTNIRQRVEIVVEHFRENVMGGLGGQAKAMVVTGSRLEAVKYRLEIAKYIEEKGYSDVRPLVAFSGTVKYRDSQWTEPGMNGIPEKKLADEFDKPGNNILVVANKYQTGFDQKKLAAMYVFKKLDGIAAVQTFGRLNRICPPYGKSTFILDFVNSADDIVAAFAPYYTTTLLSSSVTPDNLRDLATDIAGYGVIDEDDVDKAWLAYCKEDAPGLAGLVTKALNAYSKLGKDERIELLGKMRTFEKGYAFIVQAVALKDESLFKKDMFIRRLLNAIVPERPAAIDLRGKVDAKDFSQVVGEGPAIDGLESKPEINPPGFKSKGRKEDIEDLLSRIVMDLNSRFARHFDARVSAKAILQIMEMMLGSDELEQKAKNNSFDNFRLLFDKKSKELLVELFDQNKEFFTLLLNDASAAKAVMDGIARKVYEGLKKK